MTVNYLSSSYVSFKKRIDALKMAVARNDLGSIRGSEVTWQIATVSVSVGQNFSLKTILTV